MTQGVNHHSVIESFKRIGEKEGFLPIKEYSLLNITDELTDERFDLVWINKNQRVEYIFEFDLTSNGFNKSILRVGKIKGVKKYLFGVKKSLIGDIIKLKGFKDSEEGVIKIINLLKSNGLTIGFDYYDTNLELKDIIIKEIGKND